MSVEKSLLHPQVYVHSAKLKLNCVVLGMSKCHTKDKETVKNNITLTCSRNSTILGLIYLMLSPHLGQTLKDEAKLDEDVFTNVAILSSVPCHNIMNFNRNKLFFMCEGILIRRFFSTVTFFYIKKKKFHFIVELI